jgi:hypothetical protein
MTFRVIYTRKEQHSPDLSDGMDDIQVEKEKSLIIQVELLPLYFNSKKCRLLLLRDLTSVIKLQKARSNKLMQQKLAVSLI